MLKFRTIEPEEVDTVCRADREAFFASRFGTLNELDKLPSDRRDLWQSTNDFREYCTQHPDRVIVADIDGRIMGFAIFVHNEAEQTGRVYSCAVLPEARGRHLGVALVKRLLEELRNRGALRVTVSTTHVPQACRMYEKAGFLLTEKRTKKASDGTPYDCSDYEIVFNKDPATATA